MKSTYKHITNILKRLGNWLSFGAGRGCAALNALFVGCARDRIASADSVSRTNFWDMFSTYHITNMSVYIDTDRYIYIYIYIYIEMLWKLTELWPWTRLLALRTGEKVRAPLLIIHHTRHIILCLFLRLFLFFLLLDSSAEALLSLCIASTSWGPCWTAANINYAGKLFFEINLLWQSEPSVPALMGCWWRYLLAGIPDGPCFSMPEGPPRVENTGPS